MEWECDALKTFFCWRCIACQSKVPLEWRNKKKKMLKQSNHSSSDSRYSLFVIVINFPFHISSRIQRFVLALQHQYQWRLQISWHIIIFLPLISAVAGANEKKFTLESHLLQVLDSRVFISSSDNPRTRARTRTSWSMESAEIFEGITCTWAWAGKWTFVSRAH